MPRLRVPDDVASLLRGLHPNLKRKVRAALVDITGNRESGKALRAELEALRSYRVGRLRVVCRRGARGVVEVVAVGPRRVIYEETLRLLRADRKRGPATGPGR